MTFHQNGNAEAIVPHDPKVVGERLTVALTKTSWTLGQLAQALDDRALGIEELRAVEQGRGTLKIGQAWQIAKVLGLDIESITGDATGDPAEIA